MFKLFSKIFLIPLLKYVITKLAARSVEGIIIINLGNILLFAGLFLFIFAQAFGWVLIAQPLAASILGAATLLIDQESGALRMIDQEQTLLLEALSRYQIAPQAIQTAQWGFSLGTGRMLLFALVLTLGVCYGLSVAAGVPPFTTAARKLIVDDAAEVALLQQGVVQNSQVAKNAVDIVTNVSPIKTSAAAVENVTEGLRALVNTHPKASWATTVVGFCAAGFVVQNSQSLVQIGQLALTCAKFMSPASTLAAKMVAFAGRYIFSLTPFAHLANVLAEDGDEDEMDIFLKRFDKYRDLIDKDYEQIIDHFRQEKNKR